jgi:hypothetical protein
VLLWKGHGEKAVKVRAIQVVVAVLALIVEPGVVLAQM